MAILFKSTHFIALKVAFSVIKKGVEVPDPCSDSKFHENFERTHRVHNYVDLRPSIIIFWNAEGQTTISTWDQNGLTDYKGCFTHRPRAMTMIM